MANWFWNGTVQFGTGAQIISGTGTPQGVVSAPVGTIYLRTDGGVQSTLYVKETGVGNTGWTAGGSTSLASDTDVNLTSPTDTQILAYDATSGKWINVDNSGGGGGTPGLPSGSIQGNNTGSFAGVPGTVLDFTNGLVAIAPPGTGVALTVTGDSSVSDIQDWYVNGQGRPSVQITGGGSLVLAMDGASVSADGYYNSGPYYDVDSSAGSANSVLTSTVGGTLWSSTLTNIAISEAYGIDIAYAYALTFGSPAISGLSYLNIGGNPGIAVGNGSVGDFSSGIKLTKLTFADGTSMTTAASGGGSSVLRRSSGCWSNPNVSAGTGYWMPTGNETIFQQTGNVGSSSGAFSLEYNNVRVGMHSFIKTNSGSPDVGSGLNGQRACHILGSNLNLLTEVGLATNSSANPFTDCRFWVGLFGAYQYSAEGGVPATLIGGTDTPGLVFNGSPSSGNARYQPFAAFRYCNTSGGLTDTNFQAVTCDGSGTYPTTPNYTVVDTGVAPTYSPGSVGKTNSYRFGITFDDVAGNVKFYINGTLVATISSNLPSFGGGGGVSANVPYLMYVAACGYHTSGSIGFGMNLCGWEIQEDF